MQREQRGGRWMPGPAGWMGGKVRRHQQGSKEWRRTEAKTGGSNKRPSSVRSGWQCLGRWESVSVPGRRFRCSALRVCSSLTAGGGRKCRGPSEKSCWQDTGGSGLHHSAASSHRPQQDRTPDRPRLGWKRPAHVHGDIDGADPCPARMPRPNHALHDRCVALRLCRCLPGTAFESRYSWSKTTIWCPWAMASGTQVSLQRGTSVGMQISPKEGNGRHGSQRPIRSLGPQHHTVIHQPCAGAPLPHPALAPPTSITLPLPLPKIT